MMTLGAAPPALVPARMINEVLYCERLLYLEWAQGEFADNYFTVDGRFSHRRADHPGGTLPPVPSAEAAVATAEAPEEAEEGEGAPAEGLPYRARSVWLSSERLGITAKIDIVEGDAAGTVLPVEYKRGHPPEVPEGAYLPERAQLCAQVLLLREHGYVCQEGVLYFAAARQRVTITIDEALIEATLAAARRARELAVAAHPPAPLVDSPKCDGCSLVGICLPDETYLLQRLAGQPAPVTVVTVVAADAAVNAVGEEVTVAAEAEGGTGRDEAEAVPVARLRRLHPARDDQMPLYVQEQGARIGLSGDCLVVRGRTGEPVEARLLHTSQVCVMGNVQVSTQALRAMFERNIPVSFFTRGGWYCGRAVGVDSKNVELRVAQVRAAIDPAFCLRMARRLVAAKVRNCRTLLRRNHARVEEPLLAELERAARRAEGVESIEQLLGMEGTAARLYFGAFAGMFKVAESEGMRFDLEGRNRRPPRDPVNALLSFGYSLLAKDFAVTLGAVGLDPMLGFYHQPRFGRPSLALDLMEEFRPLVADSVVLGLINNGSLGERDFVRVPGRVALTSAARRRFIEAHERRMDQLITHPVFGYRISYRRVLEVQARLLGRVLLGEIEAYPEFRTR